MELVDFQAMQLTRHKREEQSLDIRKLAIGNDLGAPAGIRTPNQQIMSLLL
jgi:hypothetical protein